MTPVSLLAAMTETSSVSGRQRLPDRVRVDPAARGRREQGYLEAAAGQLLQRLQDGLVLDLGADDVPSAGLRAVVGQPEDGQVVALGRAAGEDDLVWLGIDDCGDLLAGAVDAFLGGLAVGVGPAAGVAELLGKVGQDLGLDPRVDRGGGVAVQVHGPRRLGLRLRWPCSGCRWVLLPSWTAAYAQILSGVWRIAGHCSDKCFRTSAQPDRCKTWPKPRSSPIRKHGPSRRSRAKAFEYVFPAIRGVQAGREYYVTMCPLRLIPRLFVFDEEELPPEMRAQRSLNKARVPEMARYIVDNPQSYVFSALTASINAEVQFEPFDADGGPAERVGTLIVPMSAKFVINDGQHRRAAIQQALIDSPELGDESIAIVLFLDIGLDRCQQMFADLNRYAIRPARSIGVLYDHRDEMSAITKLVVLRSAFFSDLTDMETSNLAARSRKLFTLSALYHANKALLEGVETTSLERRVDIASTLLGAWPPSSSPSGARCTSARSARARSAATSSTATGLCCTRWARSATAWRWPARTRRAGSATLRKLSAIDWRRGNAALWEGRALLGGKVSKTAANVLLTTAAIRTALGLPLPPEEQRAEDAFTRGEK